MNWKVVAKSFGVAVITTLLSFILVSFMSGCVSSATCDICGALNTNSMLWSIFVFIFSFLSSLILFGIEKSK